MIYLRYSLELVLETYQYLNTKYMESFIFFLMGGGREGKL